MNPSSNFRKKIPLIVGGLFLVSVVVWLIIFVINMLDEKTVKPKRVAQKITFIKPPPPPPPVEKPPEQKVEEEIDIPEPEVEPEAIPDAPAEDMPPMGDLGLDADGVAGADGFGLLARKGGRDLLGSRGGGRFDWYAGIAQQNISELFYNNEEIRKWKYSIVLHLWIAPDGEVTRYKIVNSSGSKEIDELLNIALADLVLVDESPPENMPQPIKLRIVSRL